MAVGPRSAGSARLFAARYSVPRAYGSHQGLLACPHVDIVYVAAVNSAHGWYVRMVPEAGKHVLCEKRPGDDRRRGGRTDRPGWRRGSR